MESISVPVVSKTTVKLYTVFHLFRQAKFAFGGSILSQFLLQTQWPLKTMLAFKVAKLDSLHGSKSKKQTAVIFNLHHHIISPYNVKNDVQWHTIKIIKVVWEKYIF